MTATWTASLADGAGAKKTPAAPGSDKAKRQNRPAGQQNQTDTVSGNSRPAGQDPERVAAYLDKVFADAIGAISSATKGHRNATLNTQAFALAQLCKGGHLDETTTKDALRAAAKGTELTAHEIEKTIESAFSKAEPRDLPEMPLRPKRNDETPEDPCPDDGYVPADGDDPIGGKAADESAVPLGNGTPPIKDSVRAQPAITLLSAADLWAPLPDPVYVIDEVIREGSIVELIAYGGSAKTWMAIDAAVSVARGIPWLGRFAAERGTVLLLDYENGNYELRRRLQAVARARGLVRPVEGIDALVMPSLYMTAPTFEPTISKLCEGRRLAVVDTLRAASPGVDENDSTMRAGLDGLRRIAETTGCAFLVLAHAKKTSGAKTEVDPREQGRGSSAIYDAADAVLHVRYVEGEPQRVSQTKARQGRRIEPFEVSVTDTANGGVLVQARALTPATVATGTEAQALRVVAQQPGTYTMSGLAKALSGERYQTRLERVRGLIDSGRLVVRDERLHPCLADEAGEDFDDAL
ncbi:MAG: AAA family ATPase [Polyangiaceae bacterium]|nr:AAA family ATPase [Polyangiaceae bacterium]